MKQSNSQILPTLCLLLATFLWASSFIALKLAFVDYHPMVVIAGRMVVASLAFFFLLPRFRKIRIRHQDFKLLGFMALCEPCLYFIFEALALKNTSASQASMITTMLPLLVAVASGIFLAERFSLQNIIGLGLAMAGAFGLSIGGDINEQAPSPLLGNLFEFLAMVCATAYTIAIKKLTSRYSPLFLTAVQAWVGALFFLPMLLLPQIQVPDNFILIPTAAIVYLGLAVTIVAYGSYNYALSAMDAGKASIYVNLIPLFTILLSWIVFKESFSLFQYCAGFVIFFGVGLSQGFWIKK
ncbi:DMT(drug/metabolite transporter) superfamily permease [Desulfocapsa sulfexigens DSM 10523]|uniref:DMT(Drug/metabolite transporter) superfamily permease n=1 Tax=Desulfocapsa sulfexigens (strain DSM 10523 / SB164P1) TaxID=1167006 RepID=M1PBD8_DESSD|nr:DMT family transporter [Desulfocapsa sulfexigens]AGF77070.1 DMT(drug/metabolite transporter) superfamily permease [Desulfocapsa sulfexigens DSM 10523]